MRALIAGALLVAATSASAVAQTRPAAAFPPQPRATTADTTSTRAEWRIDQCMGGLTYGAPLKWAVSYGMGYVSDDPDSDLCFLGAAKVGLGGAGMHLGTAFAGPFGGGGAFTVGILRTFNEPLNALARRTYAGASMHVWLVAAIGGEFGWYTRLGMDPAGAATPRSVLVWSAGFGF